MEQIRLHSACETSGNILEEGILNKRVVVITEGREDSPTKDKIIGMRQGGGGLRHPASKFRISSYHTRITATGDVTARFVGCISERRTEVSTR